MRYMGAFGCSGFFVTTDRCQGRVRGLSDDVFAVRRDACLVACGLAPSAPAPDGAWHVRVDNLERELASIQSSRSYRLARTIARLSRPVRRAVNRVAALTGGPRP